MAFLQKIEKMVSAPKKLTKRKALQERHVVTSLMTFAPEV